MNIGTTFQYSRRTALGSIMAGLCTAAASAQGEPIRILLVTGGHTHALSFYELFQGRSDYKVTVNPHPQAFRPGMIKQYDVLVLYDLADVEDEKERAYLREFLESAKGLLVLHHAIADNQDWPWWYQEVVGGRYLLKPDGSQPASVFKDNVDFDVRPATQHPVLEGIGPFHIRDEAYNQMWISPNIRVLLETDNPANGKPLAWVGPYTKSRVVYIQLGHGTEAHRSPVYQKLVHNAIAWVAAKK